LICVHEFFVFDHPLFDFTNTFLIVSIIIRFYVKEFLENVNIDVFINFVYRNDILFELFISLLILFIKLWVILILKNEYDHAELGFSKHDSFFEVGDLFVNLVY
jgi:hypothetical protein